MKASELIALLQKIVAKSDLEVCIRGHLVIDPDTGERIQLRDEITQEDMTIDAEKGILFIGPKR